MKQSFNPGPCGGSADPTVCNTATMLASDTSMYLKQGHYRNGTLNDTTFVYYKNTAAGISYNDVAPPPAGLEALSVLSDTFTGTSVNPWLWTTTAVVDESGGTLNLSPPPAPGGFAKVMSVKAYVLRNSSAQVKVPGLVDQGGGANNNFKLAQQNNESNSVQFLFEGNTLYVLQYVSGVKQAPILQLPFAAGINPYLWVRFRDAAGALNFETWDGAYTSTWVTQGSIPTPSWADAVNVIFQADSWSSVAPGTARYVYLN